MLMDAHKDTLTLKVSSNTVIISLKGLTPLPNFDENSDLHFSERPGYAKFSSHFQNCHVQINPYTST